MPEEPLLEPYLDARRHRDPPLRRVGAGVRVGDADPSRDELHGAPPARRTRCAALTVVRRARPRRCRTASCRSSSRRSARRSSRCPAACCCSTTATTRTRSRCAPRSRTSPSAPARAAASPCSARWPSSAPTRPPTTARSATLRPQLGVDELIAVGPLARDLRRRDVGRDRRARRPTRLRDAMLRPGDVVLVKGSRCGGTRGRRGETQRADGKRPRRGARRADHLDPRRPDVHRLPAPERVRPADPRGGPAAPRRQAGHADDGRPADRARGGDRLPRHDGVHAAGADDLRHACSPAARSASSTT